MFLSSGNALALENLVRRVFDAERFGVMNVANTDTLARSPMLAPIAIFSPLYLEKGEYTDIEEFMNRYCNFYFCEPSEITDDFQNSFISELKELVDKYYPKH